MLIFFEQGRLGNQLFQYAFLRSTASTQERIVLVGFEELFKNFDNVCASRIPTKNRMFRYIAYRLLVPAFESLAKLRVISSYRQLQKNIFDECHFTDSVEYKKGMFSGVRYVMEGFFQSENFFDSEIVSQIEIKKTYRLAALEFMKVIPLGSHKVFVHVRRTDYLDLRVLGHSVSLPLSYFKNRIEWFQKNMPNSFFVFLSDDPEFIEKEFSEISNKVLSSGNSVGVDLSLMANCDSAVLSNSSLSWWGAYLMSDRAIVFAAKYWLGFAEKIWYPQGIEAQFIQFIEIEDP